MLTYGPFKSDDECSYMCGWRPNENLLDYVHRINGYLMLSMSAHLRKRSVGEQETRREA